MNLAFIQGIGPTELIIVLVIVLLIFGPKRLPSLARSMGSGMREFKESISSKGADDDSDGDSRSDRATANSALGRPDEPAATTPVHPAGAVAAEARPVDGEAVPERH